MLSPSARDSSFHSLRPRAVVKWSRGTASSYYLEASASASGMYASLRNCHWLSSIGGLVSVRRERPPRLGPRHIYQPRSHS
jgi:hypothetical protein